MNHLSKYSAEHKKRRLQRFTKNLSEAIALRTRAEEQCQTWALLHKYEILFDDCIHVAPEWLKRDKNCNEIVADTIEVCLSYAKILIQMARFGEHEFKYVIKTIDSLIKKLPRKWSHKENSKEDFVQRAKWTYHTLQWIMYGRLGEKEMGVDHFLQACKYEKAEYVKHGLPSSMTRDQAEIITAEERRNQDRFFWTYVQNTLTAMNRDWEQQVASMNILRICFACKRKLDMNTRVSCKRCMTASYCSQKCRKSDSKRHENECQDGFCSWDEISALKALDLRRPYLLEQLHRITSWDGIKTLTNLLIDEESVNVFKYEHLFWELFDDIKESKDSWSRMFSAFGNDSLHSPLELEYCFVIYSMLLFMKFQLQKGKIQIVKKIHTILAGMVQRTNISEDNELFHAQFTVCYYKIKQWEWIMYTLWDQKELAIQSFLDACVEEEIVENLGKFKPGSSSTGSLTCTKVKIRHTANLMKLLEEDDLIKPSNVWNELVHSIEYLNQDLWKKLSFNNMSRVPKYRFAQACSGCGKLEGDKEHQICAACKSSYYCSEECQRLHWERHSKKCAFVVYG